MDIGLIKQLQEQDLFPPPSSEELQYRAANRPPRVLEGEELVQLLQLTLAATLRDLVPDEITSSLMSGVPLTTPGIGAMNEAQLLEELESLTHAFNKVWWSGLTTPTLEQSILKMVQHYLGENFGQLKRVQG